MKHIYLVAHLSILLSVEVFSQTPISGIINTYTEVISIDASLESISVTNAVGFSSGDEVLIIQMKGAGIDQSQSSSFGSILNLSHAGNHEVMKICAVQGSDIYFTKTLLSTYSPAGAVQLIRIPTYNDAIISGADLTAKAYDGNSGGVLILRVNGVLDFGTQNIDVSEKGFRGGAAVTSGNGCTFIDDQSYYSASSSADSKALKGEGIAKYISNKECGRGSLANGGGGGNNHNAGGGGGANYGTGGSGGQRIKASTFSCGSVIGTASQNLVSGYNLNKLFLGGGGGAGHGNNAGSTGESGMNGGGMVIIIADTVKGNAQSIMANGGSSVNAANEGGGGAGAGGTVVFAVNSFISTMSIEVEGGDGASVDNVGTSNCSGPGGGGGGGIVLFNSTSLPSGVSVSSNGGNAGVIATTSQSNCTLGSKNGAGDGQSGTNLYNWTLVDQTMGLPTENIAETACNEFDSPSGKYIWTKSGNYEDTVVNSFGCAKIVKVNLTIDSVDTRVKNLYTSLEAVAFPAFYQWLDCDNDFATVNGANAQLFKPTLNGNYAVVITSGICSDTSDCYEVNAVGMNDRNMQDRIKVFPNPTDGTVYIEIDELSGAVQLELINSNGQIIDRQIIDNQINKYDIIGPSGVYLIRILHNNDQQIFRIEKK